MNTIDAGCNVQSRLMRLSNLKDLLGSCRKRLSHFWLAGFHLYHRGTHVRSVVSGQWKGCVAVSISLLLPALESPFLRESQRLSSNCTSKEGALVRKGPSWPLKNPKHKVLEFLGMITAMDMTRIKMGKCDNVYSE